MTEQLIEQIMFFAFGLTAVISGAVMITREKPIQSAIAFLVTLLSLAGLYLLLNAQFVAVLQIIIYAGAILVLFLFVIMLLHSHSGEGPTQKLPLQRPLAVLLSLGLLVGLTYIFTNTNLGGAQSTQNELALSEQGVGNAKNIGHTLFDQFILPFEVASIVLLIGLIGAVVLATRKRGDAD